MKKIATTDSETDPFLYDRIPEPFVFGYYDGAQFIYFWGDDCAEQFTDFLAEETEKDRVTYAHNGGKFDFHFLLPFLDELITVLNGRLAKVFINERELRDSYLLLPRPLSSYKKDEIDYNIFEEEERNKPENKTKIIEYLKTDCIYLYEWIQKFIDVYDYYLTCPAAAFNQLKLTGYEPQNTSLSYDDHFREYYYGGRTEVFKSGITKYDCEYVDINSAYPYAMLDYHPYGNKYVELSEPPDNGKMYFANITAISHGALPYRDMGEDLAKNADSLIALASTDMDETVTIKSKGLYFPDDEIERDYAVTSWEIEAGLQTKTLKVIRYNYIVQHEQFKHFKEFVYRFYGDKLEAKRLGNKDIETFAKLILNSCYGKFATNGRLFKTYQLVPIGMLPTELTEYYIKYKVDNLIDLHRAIIMDDNLTDSDAQSKAYNVLTWKVNSDLPCGITIWERDEPSNRFYNVATAASITGYVRAMLWRSICQSVAPIYCDTDSIMCKKFNGIIGEELGQWKVEAILNRLYIGGKKLYAVHIKGEPVETEVIKDGVKITDESGWKKASKGSRLTVKEIINVVQNNAVIEWKSNAPSFSLRFGGRFILRKIRKT